MPKFNLSLLNPTKLIEAVEGPRYYRTISEQCSDEWFELRYGRITGTRAKYLVNGEFEALREAIYNQERRPNLEPYQMYRVEFGLKNEPIARRKLAAELGVEIDEWGLLIDKTRPRLAVSLDGYIPSLDATVEIKCPQRIVNSYRHLTGDHPDFETYLPYNYYTQVQMGLLITGAKFCYFYVYAPTVGERLLFRVPPNPDYHKQLLDRYDEFVDWLEDSWRLA